MSTDKTSPTPFSATALPARQSAPAEQGDVAQRQVAWQREMERAQMATWFKPPVADGPGNVAAPPERGSAPPRGGKNATDASLVASGFRPAATASLPDVSVGMLATNPQMYEADLTDVAALMPRTAAFFLTRLGSAAVAEMPQEARMTVEIQAQVRRGGLPPPVVGEPPEEGAQAAEAESAPEPSTAKPSSPEAQPPLRLHEESLPEGQAVWIAMRADDEALTAMLPRIVADLQRAMTLERGQRLYQVVCNGRLVWRDDADPARPIDSSIAGGDSRPTVFDSFQSKGA